VLNTVRSAGTFGVRVAEAQIDWRAVVERKIRMPRLPGAHRAPVCAWRHLDPQPRFLLPVLTITTALGLWSLIGSFRRSGEPLPLVLGLVGGAAAIMTEVVRALTHEHAYFLGYPGLALFVAAFISAAALQRRRPRQEAPAR